MPGNVGVVCVGACAHNVRLRWEPTLLRYALEYPCVVEALADSQGLVVVCGDTFDVLAALSGLEHSSLARVIVACEHASPAAVATFLDLGLAGWLAGAHDFERSREVNQRAPPESDIRELAPPSVRILEESFTVKIRDHVATLTATQFRILKLLVERAGQWTTPSCIVAEAVGTHHRADSSLVRVHLHAIRRALGPWASLIETSSRRSRGYRFVELVPQEASAARPKPAQMPVGRAARLKNVR
jgi:DNA-binding response OmpR family regulator